MRIPLSTVALGSALLLAACAGGQSPYGVGGGSGAGATGGYGPPPGSIEAMRGAPNARVIVREGPVAERDGYASPEDLARQEATAYCGRLNLDPRVVDVKRERLSLPRAVRVQGGPPTTEIERVHLAFTCERGNP